MAEIKRMSVSLSPELEQAITELRKTDEYCRSSYSEIIREVLKKGLKIANAEGMKQNRPNT